ncbi:hypothetical protein MJI12_25545, partial [Salmonella enterica subsp. enterica serovar Kentucky]|nr:hypothetical protein [Salmonella enterica subsp. enterica serovar Kentucky]
KPAAQLPFSALWALLIGIGIAFTPCVLPMYPLISGIVLGGRQLRPKCKKKLNRSLFKQHLNQKPIFAWFLNKNEPVRARFIQICD